MSQNNLKEKQFYVSGMHCASCELLIENKLLERNNIKAVEVSQKDESVFIQYVGDEPSLKKLNKLFKKDGYTFASSEAAVAEHQEPFIKVTPEGELIWNFGRIFRLLPALLTVLVIFTGFLKFSSSGLAKLSVTATSPLMAFVGFGLVAGVSTCSALVGGIVLSMSKQWAGLYQTHDSIVQKLQPQILFNLGRVISYAAIGFLLGAVGNVFKISVETSALLTVGVSIMMVVLALQMLGVKWVSRFQPKAPKSWSRYLADQRNFSGRLMPTLMGAGTVFLPCGFTITTQGLALLSGDPVRGALIMSAFVIGTVPILMIIGLSSLMFNQKPHLTRFFTQVAGFLVILFAFFNLNSAFTVLGWSNFSSLFSGTQTGVQAPSVKKQGNTQILEMTVTGGGYEPNYFQVKVNQPVEWRMTSTGAGGCANALIARDFFPGVVQLSAGQTIIKTFTPTKVGKFRFSCSMGMYTGTIEVTN